jgi:hypothetical protein
MGYRCAGTVQQPVGYYAHRIRECATQQASCMVLKTAQLAVKLSAPVVLRDNAHKPATAAAL